MPGSLPGICFFWHQILENCVVEPLAPRSGLSSTCNKSRRRNPGEEHPMKLTFALRAAAAAALTLAVAAAGNTQAQDQGKDIENRLVIVTSFSKDITEPYRVAFQKKYPGTKVEVQNRNTNAAVTFIRETRSNPPDIMWA